MYGFCSNKALYSASLSFTMFSGPAAVAQRVLQKRVCPSFLLSGYFLGIGSLVFSKFWHGAVAPWSGPWQNQIFLEKLFLLQTLEKWVKIGLKIIGLNLFKKWIFNFYWICSITKTYYLLCFCTQSIFGRNLVHGIWAKMLCANQIAVFIKERSFQNKWIKKPDFLHVVRPIPKN